MVRFLLGLGVAAMLIVGLFILGTCAVLSWLHLRPKQDQQ